MRTTGQERSVLRAGLFPHHTIENDGEWRSLVSAPGLGPGGRGFESRLPDQRRCVVEESVDHSERHRSRPHRACPRTKLGKAYVGRPIAFSPACLPRNTPESPGEKGRRRSPHHRR